MFDGAFIGLSIFLNALKHWPCKLHFFNNLPQSQNKKILQTVKSEIYFEVYFSTMEYDSPALKFPSFLTVVLFVRSTSLVYLLYVDASVLVSFVPFNLLGACLLFLIFPMNKLMSIYRGTQRQFSENICSQDDSRSRIFETVVVKFLACLPLLEFSNI